MPLSSADDEDVAPPLSSLIEELRLLERRREAAIPSSAEYIEVLGVERSLAEEIRDRVVELDRAPYWGRSGARKAD